MGAYSDPSKGRVDIPGGPLPRHVFTIPADQHSFGDQRPKELTAAERQESRERRRKAAWKRYAKGRRGKKGPKAE